MVIEARNTKDEVVMRVIIQDKGEAGLMLQLLQHYWPNYRFETEDL